MDAPRLTPRQKEVISWLSHGKSACEIGAILGCGHKTVETHKQAAMVKLGVSKDTALVAMALRKHIID